MALQAQSSQELNELTLCESGWLPLQHNVLENSFGIESHLSDSLPPEVNYFEAFSRFETPTLPAIISHDTLQPSQCICHSLPSQFGDPQLHGPSYDSGFNTFFSSPSPEKFFGSGNAASGSHSTLDSPIVLSPLQNAISAMQGSHDIADIGATICSLVEDYLKRVGGLSTIQATTTSLPSRNDLLPPPDGRTSNHTLVDSQDHKFSHRSRKTQKVANSGLIKHAKDRVTR